MTPCMYLHNNLLQSPYIIHHDIFESLSCILPIGFYLRQFSTSARLRISPEMYTLNCALEIFNKSSEDFNSLSTSIGLLRCLQTIL